MNTLKDFLAEIKELFGDRDKPVLIRRFLYDQLNEMAGGDQQEIERILNKILAEKFEQIEEEMKQREADERHDKELVANYVYLDKYLFATLNRNIKIGITNILVGKEPHYCIYTLKDYELSKQSKILTLYLERNGEEYPIRFTKISDIKFIHAGETLKTWIYMAYPLFTWRFYLYYDQDIVKQEVNSGRLIL
ncbi:hypothetical protein QO009_000439 [Brevibacillus aydinogluensis]|jgi:hypothetical protein|uniref:hypothetical protein n=1 Tax=Brevibacillus aydinogluensis TaxID=927786 RepID=UPI002892C2A9|nr:hypothetical protein [Brevibacillus aydinogluensis]MDT3414595.1 hypothetical protein [Brevibacillus aydinogluensis]